MTNQTEFSRAELESHLTTSFSSYLLCIDIKFCPSITQSYITLITVEMDTPRTDMVMTRNWKLHKLWAIKQKKHKTTWNLLVPND